MADRADGRARSLSQLSPDPSRGLFETLLIVRGRPIELDAHLDRLAASVAQVFGAALPPLALDVDRAARGMDLGRLRVQVGPEGGQLRCRASAEEVDPAIVFPDHEGGADLRSVEAGDWSGAHKWSDRRWLERVEERLGDQVPLLIGAEGNALEAGRANVFVVVGGVVATPPADGRILPGTGRAATLRLARELEIQVDERCLPLADLGHSDEVFLASSIRGIRPARSLDGAELASGPTTARLASELRRRWLG